MAQLSRRVFLAAEMSFFSWAVMRNTLGILEQWQHISTPANVAHSLACIGFATTTMTGFLCYDLMKVFRLVLYGVLWSLSHLAGGGGLNSHTGCRATTFESLIAGLKVETSSLKKKLDRFRPSYWILPNLLSIQKIQDRLMEDGVILHRLQGITEWMRLSGTSGNCVFQPLCSRRSCPVGFWMTPRMEIVQALCSTTLKGQIAFLCSDGNRSHR